MPRQPLNSCVRAAALLAVLVAIAWPLCAADSPPAVSTQADLDFFENDIRPLLAARCFECHGAEGEVKGSLSLASRAAALAGGDSGPAAVPGKPHESLLVEAIRYQGLKMPPKAKLPEAEIAKLVRWVELGMPWTPGDVKPAKPSAPRDEFAISPAQRGHWSFQPITRQAPPQVNDPAWSLEPIDRFVLARLESAGIRPNPPAAKRTLMRRATFDLTGLPPTPAEMNAFLADDAPDAFARVVERLLASPPYGERWGRHWLDVVRYADTAGETADYPVPQAYRYRNWVIAAFNRDLPYDEFLREQVAGDLLASAGPREEYADKITATGYVAISRRFGFDSENYHHLTIADTLDTLGRSVLGLSIGCARCHDHKYDPISMADYYGLYGIFSSTRYAFPGSEEKKRPRDFVSLLPDAEAAPLAKAHQEQLARHEAELKRVDGELAKLTEGIKLAEAAAASPNAPPPAAGVEAGPKIAELESEQEKLRAVAKDVRGQIDQLTAAGPYEQAYAVIDGPAANARIQKRGEPTRPGEEAQRRFLEILGADRLPDGETGSGRRQLADWLTRSSNPLTARVLVNRVWHYHFGHGLVRTTSDFGLRGRGPSHPELLDYLAGSFMADGWSIKDLHRRIMLSRVYQLTSDDNPAAAAVDPANDLRWKFERRRLDGEAIRDSVLAASGELDRTPGEAHPFPPSTRWGYTQHSPFKAVYDTQRRSVYLMSQRIQRHPLLALFDGADPNASTAERTDTTTPSQALFWMNDPLVHAQSQILARRLLSAAPDDPQRVALAYELLLGREPASGQTSAAVDFLARSRQPLAASGTAEDAIAVQAWTALVRVLMASNEFTYVD